MGHGPGSARSVETPLLALKALDLARALDDRPHLPLDGSLPNSLVRLMLYGKSACNLIGPCIRAVGRPRSATEAPEWEPSTYIRVLEPGYPFWR